MGERIPRAPAGLALAAALVVAVATGCGEPPRLHVEGPVPTPAEQHGPVYVADAMGQPLGRPAHFTLTRHTSLSRLSWRSWGETKAVATGRVGGKWCLPGCGASGFPATVELTGLTQHDRVAYYSRATVRSSGLPAEQAARLREVRLAVPGPWEPAR
ncbi:hypothetical protein GCM10010211_40730 [Streptomyces albospinus]|uniref:Lipoprotein n=1 Tax=Streptomyces albospinus TaxID=285515 RepID=A0ABQ2V8A2_9ACTN|nr:hypothetical protein [Streptomyces albospinus]GGU70877.1 hypothetical protein GCM10010211_40730 [Streptomyces albospinus]